MAIAKNENGTYPAYTDLGGYPIFYLLADGETLCADCANGKNGSLASENLDPDCPDDTQWRIVASDVNWECEDMTCAHCNRKIDSAYGD